MVITKQQNYSIRSQILSLVESEFWFLRILFVLSISYIIFEIISGTIGKKKKYFKQITVSVVLLCTLLLLSLVHGFEELRMYSLYFILGNLVFRLRKLYLVFFEKNKKIFALTFTAFFFLLCGLYFCMTGMIKWLCFKMMGLFGSVSFSVFVKAIYQRLTKSIVESISNVGKHTLPIYSIHWCLLFSMKFPAIWKLRISFYVSAISITIIWLMMCYIFIKIMKKNKIASFLLLGE